VGEFRTHVDSNRDTLSDCHSGGNGLCFGFATAKEARSGGSVEDDKTTLYLSSEAPGGKDTAECSNAKPCGEGWVEELDGKYMVLDRKTEKSFGGFMKNLVRDGGSVIVHAVPGLLDAVGTELWNIGKIGIMGKDGLVGLVTGGHVGFSSPEQGENESDLDYYARLFPFTGGVAQGAVNFYDRWLDDGGDPGRIGDDYYFAPVSTLLEDVGTIGLVVFGAGAVVKAISLGAKAAAAGATATTGLRGALASAGTKVGTWAPRLNAVGDGMWRASLVPGHVALSPLKANFMVGRFVGGKLATVVLPRIGTWAISRGAAGSMLDRAGGVLARNGAHVGAVISKGGIFGRVTMLGNRIPGLIGTVRAYSTLGLPFGRAATAADVVAAHGYASLAAAGIDAPGGPRSVLGRVLGPRRRAPSARTASTGPRRPCGSTGPSSLGAWSAVRPASPPWTPPRRSGSPSRTQSRAASGWRS
jgi:hypothetical protein